LASLPRIWTHDLRLLVVPWPLCADLTGAFPFGHEPPLLAAGALAVVAGYLASIALAARRGERAIAFGLTWFLMALLPVSNLLPMPVPAAERFLYLPLVGIALAAAGAVGWLAERSSGRGRRIGRAAGFAVLAAYVVLLQLRHADWKDDEALWRATVATNPKSCGAQSAVGGRLLTLGMERRDPAVLRESAARQELALSLCPESTDAFRAAMTYTRLGGARALLDDRDGARAALGRALELAPRYALPVAWLGYVAHLEGDRDKAAALLRRAIIELGPPDGAVAQVAQLYIDEI
jgi:tetratricopeptide (TPR) repeat protein